MPWFGVLAENLTCRMLDAAQVLEMILAKPVNSTVLRLSILLTGFV